MINQNKEINMEETQPVFAPNSLDDFDREIILIP